MKILIVGDPHFGGSYSYGRTDIHKYVNTRLLDFFNTFDYIIDYIISNDISTLVITGDIFEHRRPQASELSYFSKRIKKLRDLKVDTHIVIGNHDMIRDQKVTTVDVLRSLKLDNVHIYPNIKSTSIGNGSDIVNFIFFPFRTRSMLGCSTNDDAIKRLSDRLKYEISKIPNKFPNILVGHLMIHDTRLGHVVSESSPDEIVLPCEMFKDLDAVIMGHVHSHCVIQNNPLVAYIGSMESKDFNESKMNKYFMVIDTENKLSCKFELLPVRKLHDIIIDFSDTQEKEFTNEIKTHLKKIDIKGDIVRVTIIMDSNMLYYFNKESLRKFLRRRLKVHHCIGIHPQIISKRQLRKATITERNDPLSSFNEYLDLEADSDMREKMREIGVQIIKDRKLAFQS